MAHDDNFEVTLKFGGVPKYLRVPYNSITRFHDPSVGFALQFEPPKEMDPSTQPATLASIAPSPAKSVEPEPEKKPKKKKTRVSKAKKDAEKGPSEDQDGGDDKVVSLDAFRKK